MKTTGLAVLALSLSLITLAPGLSRATNDLPPTSSPTDTQVAAARTRFNRAVGLYAEGEYRAALIEFRRAHEIAPNYRILYNIGQVNAELREYADALKAFSEYLRQGAGRVPEPRRKTVLAEIERLKGRVGHIRISANVAGARILIDGISVGMSPLTEPIPVTAGRHKVTATKENAVPAVLRVDVPVGDEVRAHLVVTQVKEIVAQQTRATSERRAAETSERTLGKGFWVSLGCTGVLVAATGVLGALALMAESDYRDALETIPTTPEAIDAARTKMGGFALATDIALGSAIVAAGVTLYFAFFGSPGTKAVERSNSAAVTASVGPRGIAILGRF